MISPLEIRKLVKLLRQEVRPSIGCIEPMMVAFACAKAREVLGMMPEKVCASLSSHITKFAMGVGIPKSHGMVGIQAAMALGTLSGKADKGLDVLSEITEADTVAARQYIAEHHCVAKLARNTFEIIYVEVEATAGDNTVKIIVAKEATNVVFVKHNGEVVVDQRNTLATEHDRNHESELTMKLIYEFATKCPLDEIQFLLKGARVNKEVANMAFVPEANYGLNLGKMLRGTFQERMLGQNAMPRIVCFATAAADVRMSGEPVTVTANSGSGNQGIIATMPVLTFAEETQCTEAKTIRALAISHLTNIYIRQLLGKMSAHCGCVLSATGAACGITLLMGGDYEQVCHAVKNQIAGATGMICDGCKPSCVLKLSQAVSSSFQSAMMAMENICVASTDGIIEDDVDKSLDNLASLGRDAMQEVDNVLINIMTDKNIE